MLDVVEKGYRANGTILRPARVVVSVLAMPAVKDPYKTLGVDKKASDDEIKKAYRKLAREYHPDRNPGDAAAEERFKDIQGAYDILSDPEKRKDYDSGGGIFGGAGGFDPGAFRGNFGGIGDILSDLFGGAGRGGPAGSRPERGRDLETDVHVSFEQAMEGAQVPVSVPLSAPCPTCHGTGAKPGTSPTICSRCQGRGVEAESQGLFSISQPCRQCGGTGTEIKDPCPTCQGTGRTRQVKRYRVNIPAGVRDGSRVGWPARARRGRAAGRPATSTWSRAWASRRSSRARATNLEVEVPITIPEAIRGATIEVPTLTGTKRIRVPPGTQHGTVQRLRGEGPPKLGGRGRGDIHYRLSIDVPSSLSREQSEAVDDLAAVMDGNPRERLLSQRQVSAWRPSDSARGVYMISVAAELAGMHPQTLRIYEARGLITPKRSPKNTRLYSQEDVERLRRIQELTTELGMNLAGVEKVFELEEEMERMRRRMRSLERQAAKVQQELSAEIDRVRRSMKHELVLYEPPSQSLIGPGVRVPIRRPAR